MKALTEDDWTVIAMVSEGYNHKAIGDAMAVSEYLTKRHIKRLQDRLGAVNPASLVRRAYEQGFLKVGER